MNYRLIMILALVLTVSSSRAQTLVEEIEAIADVVVDINGTGDFTTVQAGIKSIPDNNDSWKIILVKNGTYYEKVILGHTKTKVILVGEDVDSTKITYDDYGNKVLPGHTFSTYTFRADANDFQAFNISFECTAGGRGQGVAYHSNGDRQILYHCRLLGEQDTYFDNFRTRRYIKDCFIEGTTDYIFGFGVTLFDSCQIHSLAGSYITAASTPQHYEFGYVFKDSRLTGGLGVNGISLGRPWFDWSNTIFFECWEPAALKAEGWGTWSGREATCIYQEYNCFGPGSDTLNRVSFGHQLNPALAPRYTIDTILASSNFPTHLGYVGDTTELMHLYRRFEASGYPERADTILYAGRDAYPTYPTDDWSPKMDSAVLSIIDKHTIAFMDSLNGEVTVQKLLVNGVEIPDFDPENLFYAIELDDTVSVVPELSLIGEGVSTTIEYPETIPGVAYVTALSRDKVNGAKYKLYLSQDSAYWDAELHSIIINYEDTIDIISGQYSYDVVLPQGQTRPGTVIIKAKVPEQKNTREYPTEYPGVITITVTAPDGETVKVYELNVELTPSSLRSKMGDDGIYVVNPAGDDLQIYYTDNQSFDGEISLYDLSGKPLLSENIKINAGGATMSRINISHLKSGIYLYRLKSESKDYSGKFMKTE